MSRWVVNASPLIYLSKLDRLDLLQHSADEILVPSTVVREVCAKTDDAASRVEIALDSCPWSEPWGCCSPLVFEVRSIP